MVGDARLQGLNDSPGQRFELVGGDAVDGRLGMDAGAEQGFVGIDVSNAGDGALVQQGGFDGHLAIAKGVAEGAPVKVVAQGFGSKIADDGGQLGFVQRPGSAEAADVDEVQGRVSIQAQHQPGVRLDGVGRAQVDAAAHHQVQDEDAVGETQQQVLAAAVDALHALADEAEFKLLDRQAKVSLGSRTVARWTVRPRM